MPCRIATVTAAKISDRQRRNIPCELLTFSITFSPSSPVPRLLHRVVSEEKSHRQELSHLKIKHESGLSIMKDELHSLNQQVSKYKRERDTYKTMLEGAQRTIGDLKRKSRAQEDGVDAAEAADVSGGWLGWWMVIMMDERDKWCIVGLH